MSGGREEEEIAHTLTVKGFIHRKWFYMIACIMKLSKLVIQWEYVYFLWFIFAL